MNELKARGVAGALIAVCDGPIRLPEATFGCLAGDRGGDGIMHPIPGLAALGQLQQSQDGRPATAPIYTSPTEAAARAEVEALTDSGFRRNDPGVLRRWCNSWELVIPFFDFARKSASSTIAGSSCVTRATARLCRARC